MRPQLVGAEYTPPVLKQTIQSPVRNDRLRACYSTPLQLVLLTMVFLGCISITFAQSCPADIIRAQSRAGAACNDLERNQACYGNGTVQADFEGGNAAFSLVGERAALDLMSQLRVGSDESTDYSIASLQLQASLLNSQPGRNLFALAISNVTLINQVPVRPTIRVTSNGQVNLRRLPQERESDIVQQLPLRSSLTANGITADGQWLRVEVPNTSDIAWVSRSVLNADSAFNSLNIVDVDTPFLRPFQVMSLSTGFDDAPCTGTAESGVILQAPNIEETVTITVNGVELSLAGTIFIQAQAAMSIYQLDGYSAVTNLGVKQYLVAGAKLSVDAEGIVSAAEPYLAEDVVGVPVNNLAYRVRIPAPISPVVLDAQIARLLAAPTPTPVVNRADYPQVCIRSTNRRVTLYAGPATFHEIIQELPRSSRVYAVLALTDSSGTTWWQLNNGHWMLADSADSTGDCRPVPVTEIVQAPTYNRLNLERCESDNGPIRAGQTVTIEFVDGSWISYAEAMNAIRVDPGRISVGQQRLYIQHAAPVQVTEDRWYRTFSAQWLPEAGTYRIVGNRLHYTVICDVTVPLG